MRAYLTFLNRPMCDCLHVPAWSDTLAQGGIKQCGFRTLTEARAAMRAFHKAKPNYAGAVTVHQGDCPHAYE